MKACTQTDPLASQVPAIHFYIHLYNVQKQNYNIVIFCKTCYIPDYSPIHSNRIRMLNDYSRIYSIYEVLVRRNLLTHIYDMRFFFKIRNAMLGIESYYDTKTSLHNEHYCSDNILHLNKTILGYTLLIFLLHNFLSQLRLVLVAV